MTDSRSYRICDPRIQQIKETMKEIYSGIDIQMHSPFTSMLNKREPTSYINNHNKYYKDDQMYY
jgi:hypothetical protein